MAQKGGFKRFLLVLLFLALAAVVFILFGGGKLLKETGQKAEEVKHDIEKKASSVEKKAATIQKALKDDKTGEKK
jgi:lipopolysaccharide export LptBFGC system permease protein LptF